MSSGTLKDFGLLDSPSNGFSDMGFVNMVTLGFFRLRDNGQCLCRKEPLPRQFLRGIFIFLFQRTHEKRTGISCMKILFVQLYHSFKMRFQLRHDFLGQWDRPVLFAISIMHS